MTTVAVRTVAAVLILVAVMAGCRSLTGQSAGTDVDDSTITASVKSKLVADKAANLTRVDVDTNHRTVTLTVRSIRPNRKRGQSSSRGRRRASRVSSIISTCKSANRARTIP